MIPQQSHQQNIHFLLILLSQTSNLNQVLFFFFFFFYYLFREKILQFSWNDQIGLFSSFANQNANGNWVMSITISGTGLLIGLYSGILKQWSVTISGIFYFYFILFILYCSFHIFLSLFRWMFRKSLPSWNMYIDIFFSLYL